MPALEPDLDILVTYVPYGHSNIIHEKTPHTAIPIHRTHFECATIHVW